MKKTLLLFTGTHSTGKTSTLNALTEVLRIKHDKLLGGSRVLKELGIIKETDAKADTVDQMLINAEMALKMYETVTTDSELVISERSPVDVLAYASMLSIPKYVIEYNNRLLRTTINRTDVNIIFIYFPMNIPYVADEVRVAESRDIIDSNIMNIMNIYGIKYYTLKMLSIQDRVREILKLINLKE